MRRSPLSIALLIWLSLSAFSPGSEFSETILPILSNKCFHCHGPDEKERKSGLRLDSFAGATQVLEGSAAIVPGDSHRSQLVQRIFSGDPDTVMPPPESKLSLNETEKRALQKWIKAGAEYEEHWAFQKPTRPKVPKPSPNPIDAFIGGRLAAAAMDFSPEATPERLIRRVTLDLNGLPPTPDEVDAFTFAYEQFGESAYGELVDRLIASPRYGETMALPWLDAARFADTDGYQYDGPRFMWRWRDWVIDAYNANMPFDQFTIEQLAGDLLPNPTLEQVIATGFNRNHRYNSESGAVVEEFLLENAVDRVDTVSTLWMGLTVGCARCHDHKYDPISQKDYYQLIAFFNNVPEAGRAIKSRNSEPVILAPTRDQQVTLKKKREALAAATASLTPGKAPTNGPVLVNRRLALHSPLSGNAKKGVQVPEGSTLDAKGLHLDGTSMAEVSGVKKEVRFRANDRFTVSFWVKADSVGDSVILSRQNPSPTRPGIEIALIDGGRIRFDLISRWLAGVGRATTLVKLPANQWTHLTLSNDGSQSGNGQLIYLNGKSVETEVTYNTNSNVGGVEAKRPILLGGGVRKDAKHFKGSIRDLRVYETTLWPEEIAVLGTIDQEVRANFGRTSSTPNHSHYVKLREELESYEKTLPTAMVMRESAKEKVTHIRNRGVYNDHGPIVSRDVPGKLPPMPKSLPKNRLGLANWLLAPDHPLTARVAVNRYWQRYFGTGLVKTAEDFGIQGEAPSHPELLDWLATEFVRTGWDVAAMQKLIVSSRAYRQQSKATELLRERDPENRLLARGPRHRLSGHALRDQALFVSGLLKERIGGPSVSPYQPANLWAEMSMGMKYKQSKGDDLYRRSLYTIWKRTIAPPTMSLFDAADREACWVKVKNTNTPLQALTLLNETGFMESARHLAVRMLKEGGRDPIAFGFRCVTARAPAKEERAVLDYALATYQIEFSSNRKAARKLIRIGESPANTDYPAEKLAAYTALANVLLNLDEAITKE